VFNTFIEVTDTGGHDNDTSREEGVSVEDIVHALNKEEVDKR
jgi:hypothetical protein